MRYAVIIEKGADSYGTYVPALPGCVAVGKTKEGVIRLTEEAVEFHLEGMREDGLPLLEPVSTSEMIDVAA